MSEFDDYRAAKMESAGRFQDHVVRLLFERKGIVLSQFVSGKFQREVGETLQGWEIKNDEKFATTRNLWIEVGEKAKPRDGDYFPSGIMRADNSWMYVIGDYTRVFIFAKRTLVLLAEAKRWPVIENNLKTSIGFLMPEASVKRYAALVIEAEEETATIMPPVSRSPADNPSRDVTADDIRWG